MAQVNSMKAVTTATLFPEQGREFPVSVQQYHADELRKRILLERGIELLMAILDEMDAPSDELEVDHDIEQVRFC